MPDARKDVCHKASLVAICCFAFTDTTGFRGMPTATFSSSNDSIIDCPSSPSFTWSCLPPPTIKAPSSIPNKTQISHPVTNMNKLLCVVVPCILTLALYISIYSLYSPALSPSDQLFGRKLLGEHQVPTSEPAGEQKLENLEAKQSFIREEHDDGDGEGLILNADYHGVTTHPSPLPKHPRP